MPALMAIHGSARAKPVSEVVPTLTTGGAANRKRPGCARPQLFEPVIAPGSITPSRDATSMRLAVDETQETYRIDVMYRMLFERELFNAQGFRRDYVIDRTADGRKLTRTQAIRMVGNSVSPPPMQALIEASLDKWDDQIPLAA